MKKPKYPVYVISKGRADTCLTANFLLKDKVDFKLVIEPQEYDKYVKHYDPSILITTPFKNLGLGSIPVRNFVWEHSKELGFKRHWIMDDNILSVYRKYKNTRIRCNSNIALRCCEDFTDRYTNIALSGLNYYTFAITRNQPPFYLNAHIYSTLLIDNSLDIRWRGRYNEDTDLCLQALSLGLCTVKGDGRLTMARSLEKMWPKVVKTTRKFQRPQHHIQNNWQKFDTQLIRRKDIDWDNLQKTDNYGLRLVQLKQPKSGSQELKKLFDE
jgi:hypothetical protein